jgi:nucleotide-binding universal stress UspA family protein
VDNRVLVFAEALDVAAEGAVWYARRIGHGSFEALHVPGPKTDTGIHARWFDFTGGEPRLDMRPEGTDATAAVLAEVAKLRDGDGTVVTVVLPEQFTKKSLVAAAQRSQFRLKLRLLSEPGVVVADVTAVTSERRPEGHVPEHLVVRVLVKHIDEAARQAVEYAKALGVEDIRVVNVGDEDASGFGLEVDKPAGDKLRDRVLGYVRALTADPETAVNVVLPERVQSNMKLLRNREGLELKRCLLFEPHVILSSVPHRD